MFYDMEAEIPCETKEKNIYTLCGKDKNGKTLTVVTYYTENEKEADDKKISIDFGKDKKNAKYEIYLLDETHDSKKVEITSDLTLLLKPNTCVLIKEID